MSGFFRLEFPVLFSLLKLADTYLERSNIAKVVSICIDSALHFFPFAYVNIISYLYQYMKSINNVQIIHQFLIDVYN